METSIFSDKAKVPTLPDLKAALGNKYVLWSELRDFVVAKYPPAKEEWSFPGKNYGWNFRIKDKKRAIIYFLPRDGFFKVAFSFNQKAFEQVLASDVAEHIKTELAGAKAYVEGRGVRIDITAAADLPDIKRLVEIKLAN